MTLETTKCINFWYLLYFSNWQPIPCMNHNYFIYSKNRKMLLLKFDNDAFLSIVRPILISEVLKYKNDDKWWLWLCTLLHLEHCFINYPFSHLKLQSLWLFWNILLCLLFFFLILLPNIKTKAEQRHYKFQLSWIQQLNFALL